MASPPARPPLPLGTPSQWAAAAAAHPDPPYDPRLWVPSLPVPLRGDNGAGAAEALARDTLERAQRKGLPPQSSCAVPEAQQPLGEPALASSDSSSESVGGDRRRDLPRAPARKRVRGSMRKAVEIMANTDKLTKARKLLIDDTLANSSRSAKNSKRKGVEGLARMAAGSTAIYPLTEEVVVDVAAALKGANYHWP